MNVSTKPSTKSRGKLEDQVRKECKRWLDKNGYYSPAISNMGFYCTKGFSDAILVKNGVVIFCEYKKEKGGVQSPDQKKFQATIEDHGGIYILVNSIESLVEQLTGEKQLCLQS